MINKKNIILLLLTINFSCNMSQKSDNSTINALIETNKGEIKSKFLVWAAGEFQYPRSHSFPGAKYCIHNSLISNWNDVQGDEFFVKADQLALERVLVNFIDNAIKYSPKNSNIVIKSIDRIDHIEINIIDSGDGIDDNDKELIFGRFFRTAQARASDATGSGLGLAIVKNLVGSLKGDVGLKNADTGGSNFWFTLPKAQNK